MKMNIKKKKKKKIKQDPPLPPHPQKEEQHKVETLCKGDEGQSSDLRVPSKKRRGTAVCKDNGQVRHKDEPSWRDKAQERCGRGGGGGAGEEDEEGKGEKEIEIWKEGQQGKKRREKGKR